MMYINVLRKLSRKYLRNFSAAAMFVPHPYISHESPWRTVNAIWLES